MTRETVETDTPAFSATSFKVNANSPFLHARRPAC